MLVKHQHSTSPQLSQQSPQTGEAKTSRLEANFSRERSPFQKLCISNLADYLKKKIKKSMAIPVSKRQTEVANTSRKVTDPRVLLQSQVFRSEFSKSRGRAWVTEESVERRTWERQANEVPQKMDLSNLKRPMPVSTLAKLAARISQNSAPRDSWTKESQMQESQVICQVKFHAGSESASKVRMQLKNIDSEQTLKSKVQRLESKTPQNEQRNAVKKPVLTGELVFSPDLNLKIDGFGNGSTSPVVQKKWDLSIKNMPNRISQVKPKNSASNLKSPSRGTQSPGSDSRRHQSNVEEITFRPQFSGQISPGQRASIVKKQDKHVDLIDHINMHETDGDDDESSCFVERKVIDDFGMRWRGAGGRREKKRDREIADQSFEDSVVEMLKSRFEAQEEIIPSESSEAKTIDKFDRKSRDESKKEPRKGLASLIVFKKDKSLSSILGSSIGVEKSSSRGSIDKNRERLRMIQSRQHDEDQSSSTLIDKQTPHRQQLFPESSSSLSQTRDFINVKDYSVCEPWARPPSNNKLPSLRKDVLTFGKVSMGSTGPNMKIKPALKYPSTRTHEMSSLAHLSSEKNYLNVRLALPNNPNTPSNPIGIFKSAMTFGDMSKHINKAIELFDDYDR